MKEKYFTLNRFNEACGIIIVDTAKDTLYEKLKSALNYVMAIELADNEEITNLKIGRVGDYGESTQIEFDYINYDNKICVSCLEFDLIKQPVL